MNTPNIANKHNKLLVEVLKDKKGNVWFSHKNPLEIGAIRGVNAERKGRFVGMMITQKELTLMLDEHSKCVKEMDFIRAFAIIDEIKHRLKFLTEEKSILDLAGIYYFLDGEDIDESFEYWEEKKQKIWEEDTECRRFFIHVGLSLTEKLRDMSETDSLQYLEETEVFQKRIYRFIPRPTKR